MEHEQFYNKLVQDMRELQKSGMSYPAWCTDTLKEMVDNFPILTKETMLVMLIKICGTNSSYHLGESGYQDSAVYIFTEILKLPEEKLKQAFVQMFKLGIESIENLGSYDDYGVGIDYIVKK